MMTIEEQIKYVNWFLSRRKGIPYSDFEDVQQECLMNIHKNKEKYDHNRAKWSTFMFYLCREAVSKFMKKYTRRHNTIVSLESVDTDMFTNNTDFQSIDNSIEGYTTSLKDTQLF